MCHMSIFLLSLSSIQIATDKLAQTHFAKNKRIAIENVPCSKEEKLARVQRHDAITL